MGYSELVGVPRKTGAFSERSQIFVPTNNVETAAMQARRLIAVGLEAGKARMRPGRAPKLPAKVLLQVAPAAARIR